MFTAIKSGAMVVARNILPGMGMAIGAGIALTISTKALNLLVGGLSKVSSAAKTKKKVIIETESESTPATAAA